MAQWSGISDMESKPRVKIYSDGTHKEMVGGAFEGASRLSQEIAMWNPANQSANQEISEAKEIVDARSKDMSRNDGYIAGAIDTHKDSIVGAQFSLNSKPNLTVLQSISKNFTEEWLEEHRVQVEAQFTIWAESSENYVDAQGINNFTGLIRLGTGLSVVTGEILATSEWIRGGGSPFNTAIQMIDVDRLSNPNGVADHATLSRGISTNKFGKPLVFHIRGDHPSEYNNFQRANSWKPVNARKPWGRKQVIHIYEQQRANQSRSVSKIVSVLKELSMTKKYKDVVLQNAVMNATFAATLESELPAEVSYDQLKTSSEDYMNQVAAYSGKNNRFKVDGAKVTHLWPGQKLNLQTPSSPGGVGDDFESSLWGYIAAPLGLSREELTGDFTKTNFASAKAAMGNTRKHMMGRKKMFADRFATNIFQLWYEEALNKGIIALPAGVDYRKFYTTQMKDALTACSWIGAGESQLDQSKHIDAAIKRINANLSTHEIEAAVLGNDFRDVFAQNKREAKMKKDLGLLPIIAPVDTKDVGKKDES